MDVLRIPSALALQAENGGLFVATTPSWTHPQRIIGSYELVFVKDGVLSLWEDDQRFDVRAGEALLLRPGCRHGGAAPSPTRLRFYWTHFTLGDSDAGAAAMELRQHVRVARPDHMTALFRRLLDDQELYGSRSLTLGLLVMLMACEIARSSRSGPSPSTAPSMLAAKADVVIQTKFHEPISAASIAAELRCNPDYLGRVFRSVYGKTLTDALHERRVRHAAGLLAETGQGMDDIAHACGFSDVVYFRRVFKRVHGLTPSAHRSLHTRMHINHR
jgi:AraC-like DNA-binding protein